MLEWYILLGLAVVLLTGKVLTQNLQNKFLAAENENLKDSLRRKEMWASELDKDNRSYLKEINKLQMEIDKLSPKPTTVVTASGRKMGKTAAMKMAVNYDPLMLMSATKKPRKKAKNTDTSILDWLEKKQ